MMNNAGKMKIDRSNYESYFLDFLEGRLPEKEVDELMAFINLNPDIEEILPYSDKYVVESNKELSLNKNFLFKSLENFDSINDSNFEEFCIAWYENDLSDASRKSFLKYLETNPAKSNDFESYGKVFLKPDLKNRFPHKSQLKKFVFSPAYRLISITSAAAAILFIFFYLYPFNKQFDQKNSGNIALSQKQSSSVSKSRVPVLAMGQTVSANTILSNKVEVLQHNSLKSIPVNMVDQPDSAAREIINLALIDNIKFTKLSANISSENIALLQVSQINIPLVVNSNYPGLLNFAFNRLSQFLDGNSTGSEDESDLSFWNIAKMGVSGINKLTGSDIKLNRKIDEQGKITAMAVESGSLGFSRSVSK
jgi:hypothetical protein